VGNYLLFGFAVALFVLALILIAHARKAFSEGAPQEVLTKE